MNFQEIYQDVPAPHIPQKLPVELSKALFDTEIIKLIANANNAMGAYRGFLVNTINPMLLISPLVSQEAVLSSKLEGTHATIEDFINYDAGNRVPVPKDEMQEVMNYRTALFYALESKRKKLRHTEQIRSAEASSFVQRHSAPANHCEPSSACL